MQFRQAALRRTREGLVADFRVVRSNDGQPEEEILSWRTFESPLTSEDLDLLRWYLEKYGRWPFGAVRRDAEEFESKLAGWGRALFDRLLGDVPALERHLAGTEVRIKISAPFDRRSKVETEPQLMSLPWELIGDAQLPLGSIPIVREVHGQATLDPVVRTAEHANVSNRLNVLMVVSRPADAGLSILDPRPGFISLLEHLADFRERVRVKVLESGSLEALSKELQHAAGSGESYQVVHFDGHGYFDETGGGHLCFEQDVDRPGKLTRARRDVSATDFAELLRVHHVPLVVLEACQTAQGGADDSVAGAVLAAGIRSVVATTHAVLDTSARAFSEALYFSLSKGASISQAVLDARHALQDTRDAAFPLRDWFVPVVYQSRGADGPLTKQSTAIQEAPRSETQEERRAFVGRSVELLYIQRAISNFETVFIHGRIGEGKSALSTTVARWQEAIGRFETFRTAHFGGTSDDAVALHAIAELLGIDDASARGALEQGTAAQALHRAFGDRQTLIILDDVLFRPDNDDGARFARELAMQAVPIPNIKVVITTSTLVLRGVPDAAFVTIGPIHPSESMTLIRNVIVARGKEPAAIPDEDSVLWAIALLGSHCRSVVRLADAIVARVDIESGRPYEIVQRILGGDEDHLRHLRERSALLPPSCTVAKALGAAVGAVHVQIVQHVTGTPIEQAAQICAELTRFGLAVHHEAFLHPEPALALALRPRLEDPFAVERLWCGAALRLLLDCLTMMERGAPPQLRFAFEHGLPGIVETFHLAESWLAAGLGSDPDSAMPLLGAALALAQHRGAGVKQLMTIFEVMSRRFSTPLATALAEFHRIRGQYAGGDHEASFERLSALRASLRETGDRNSQAIMPAILSLECELLRKLGRGNESETKRLEAAEALRAASFPVDGQKEGQFDLVMREGHGLRDKQLFADAERCYRRALELVRDDQNPMNRGVYHSAMGLLRHFQKHFPESVDHHRYALAIFTDRDTRATATAMVHLAASLLYVADEFDNAEALLLEALPLVEALKDRETKATALFYLGQHAVFQRAEARAESYFKDALEACGSGPSAQRVGMEGAIAELRKLLRTLRET